jgi:hypothetical protein
MNGNKPIQTDQGFFKPFQDKKNHEESAVSETSQKRPAFGEIKPRE